MANSCQLHSKIYKMKTDSLANLCKRPYPEAVVRRCSVKKVFLKISQNSQENTCAKVSFLIKLQASGTPLVAASAYHLGESQTHFRPCETFVMQLLRK